MVKLLSIAIGGAVGTLLRYAVSGLTYRYVGGVFPWGTLSVNLIGSFIIGVLGGIFEKAAFSSNLKMFILIGILGAFTTFSTYSLESFNLFRSGEIKLMVSNVLINNVLGIILVLCGFITSRYL
ncbi:MAG: fluoride efflux transporter CrcB [Nitrospirota bacterium]